METDKAMETLGKMRRDSSAHENGRRAVEQSFVFLFLKMSALQNVEMHETLYKKEPHLSALNGFPACPVLSALWTRPALRYPHWLAKE